MNINSSNNIFGNIRNFVKSSKHDIKEIINKINGHSVEKTIKTNLSAVSIKIKNIATLIFNLFKSNSHNTPAKKFESKRNEYKDNQNEFKDHRNESFEEVILEDKFEKPIPEKELAAPKDEEKDNQNEFKDHRNESFEEVILEDKFEKPIPENELAVPKDKEKENHNEFKDHRNESFEEVSVEDEFGKPTPENELAVPKEIDKEKENQNEFKDHPNESFEGVSVEDEFGKPIPENELAVPKEIDKEKDNHNELENHLNEPSENRHGPKIIVENKSKEHVSESNFTCKVENEPGVSKKINDLEGKSAILTEKDEIIDAENLKLLNKISNLEKKYQEKLESLNLKNFKEIFSKDEVSEIENEIDNLKIEFKQARKALVEELEEDYYLLGNLQGVMDRFNQQATSLKRNVRSLMEATQEEVKKDSKKHEWIRENLVDFKNNNLEKKNYSERRKDTEGNEYLFVKENELTWTVSLLTDQEIKSEKNLIAMGTFKTVHYANQWFFQNDKLMKIKNKAVGYQSRIFDPESNTVDSESKKITLTETETKLFSEIKRSERPQTGIKSESFINSQVSESIITTINVDKRYDNSIDLYLKKGPLSLPGWPVNELRKHIALQFLTALTTFQKVRFIHGDLKPANILIDLKTGDIAIGDLDTGAFGVGPDLVSSPYEYSNKETILSHELEKSEIDRDKATILAHKYRDVTAGAMTLIEIIMGKQKDSKMLRTSDILSQADPPVPQEFISLIEDMLNPDPEKRLTAEQALERLKEIDWNVP